MNSSEIIRTFVEFFQDRGHRRITGASLLPPVGDPVLFTTAGMHPLTPYLEGRPHPLGRRLVSVQRCLRTTDLDEVGDRWHLTVFEMLGSWSLGDYLGMQSLRWGYELLRDGFGVDPGRMYATVFGGDEQVGPDTESLETWRELGVPVELTGRDNWWDNGPTGPCGPDSEIFVWTGDTPAEGRPSSDPRWVEVWNHVMMRYRRDEQGHLHRLMQSNVDTGMGLERLSTVLGGKKSVFDGDLFEPWTDTLRERWQPDQRSLRVLCDHLRSSVVVIGDGVQPSNTRHGYVLRRLIRRALTTMWRDDATRSLADLPTPLLRDTLRHFDQDVDPDRVRQTLVDEERRFRSLLERGREVLRRLDRRGPLTDKDFRHLHDTYGLPRDLVVRLLSEMSGTATTTPSAIG